MEISQTIAKDMVVSLHYTLTLDNGEEVDSTSAEEPLYYLHGHENILPALEKKLAGHKIGKKLKVIIPAEEAYGLYDEDGFHSMDRSLFPDDFDLEIGMLLNLKDDNGEEMDAFVDDISEEEVFLDTNHPLAGETLHFAVEVLDIRSATAEEIDHGHAHVEAADHS